MHWIYLVLAIVFEVAGTTCMKLSAGFARVLPTVFMGVCYCVCFSFMTLAIKRIDVSVAYAVWSGVGIALIAVIGVCCFDEPISLPKAAGLLAIIGGILTLNLAGGAR